MEVCSGWILVHELGIALLSSGKVVILALSLLETARVSISNEVGYFDISPEELCAGPLFPCKTHSTKIELSVFQKIYNYLSGINEKVVSLENVRTVFGLNKQMMFAVLILLIASCVLLNNPFWKDSSYNTGCVLLQ